MELEEEGHEMLQIEKPVNETQMIMVKNLRKKEHMKFIIAEILARRYPNDQVDAIDQKNAAEDELKKISTVKELRKELLKELNEDDESTEFKLCSKLALNFGAYNLTKN